MTDHGPPSMRQFDYFAASATPVTPESLAANDGLPEAVELKLEELRRAKRRAGVAATSATLLLLASAWLLWGLRDRIHYAFMSSQPPQQLGDVVDLSPQDIPHNAYVEVSGVTEHRGMRQEAVRGVVPVREEYWYFRLLGAQGVFIEVPPDAERYGYATQVVVRGRAVDPRREPMYLEFLRDYSQRFVWEATPHTRVIQVGLEPGFQRGVFAALLFVLAGLAVLDAVALLRFLRWWRQNSSLVR